MSWIQNSYRRNLIDMHIDDWNDAFFSELSPGKYVEMLKRAHVKSAMVYSQSHVGLCNWPSRFGNMHKGLGGRDFLGETIHLCHQADIDVVVYFSLIYDNWAYEKYPAWRMVDAAGLGTRQRDTGGNFGGARYGNICPNNMEYRKYVEAQIEDLCNRYAFEGMFFDMLFWTGICHCESCKARFGRDIPAVDWNDPAWTAFQGQREAWMSEFAQWVTDCVKKHKPHVTVQHQFAPAVQNWRYGVNEGIAKASDYVGGDKYGGIAEQSFICKLFREITPNMPFEYMSSRCDPDLSMHTITKTTDYIKLHNYIALAHGGAFLFIDAINPDGSIDPQTYDTMGEIFKESQKYEVYTKGELQADVAVYFSFNSKMEREAFGLNTEYMDFSHLHAVTNACESLRRAHIPYTVITKSSIEKPSERFDVIVLPDVCVVDDDEAAYFKDFVQNGGKLYISGHAAHPVLQKLAGISKYMGMTDERITYITPNGAGEAMFPGFCQSRPLSVRSRQALVECGDEAQVLATLTLPYTDPADGSRFAAIHSNPPGIRTAYPAVIKNGHVLWISAPIEKEPPDVIRGIFVQMIHGLMDREPAFQSDAPAAIEIVLSKQGEKKIVGILNEQDILPAIPARDVEVMVKADLPPSKVHRVSDGAALDFDMVDGYVRFTLPIVEIFEMVIVE